MKRIDLVPAVDISSGDACKYAVVTGSNKGIGFEVVKQLTNSDVTVLLTARDEKRGAEATSLLNERRFSNVVFHQLNVQDAQSIESLAKFVNSAGVSGVVPDEDVLRAMNMDLVNWLMPNEEMRKELGDIENLTEEKIDGILQNFFA
uniref:Uncharacterized protein n=1 Tax=Solanum lycopersicum TaxID=4081 RepID=A0A3Q7IWQ7_SOLLC